MAKVPNYSLPPNSLPSNPRPTPSTDIRYKLRQFPFILRFPDKPTYRMHLPRPAAAPHNINLPHIAAHQAHLRGALAEGAEVDVERAIAVEFAQRADAVADARGQNAELGPRSELLAALQFRRR